MAGTGGENHKEKDKMGFGTAVVFLIGWNGTHKENGEGGKIKLRATEGRLTHLELTKPSPCISGEVHVIDCRLSTVTQMDMYCSPHMNSVNIMGSSVSIREVHAAILQPPTTHSIAPDNVCTVQTSQHDEQHDAKQTTSNTPNVTWTD